MEDTHLDTWVAEVADVDVERGEGREHGAAETTTPPKSTRWWQQPLLHFLVLGAVLVALDSAGQAADSDGPSFTIEVTAEHVAELKHALLTIPGATSTQLDDEIQRFAEHEALVREARRLGLERGDLIIRRRLIQKMEFLIDDLVAVQPATESELRAWLETHREKYREPARYDVEHVFFSRERRRDHADADADAALAAWRRSGQMASGDPFLGGSHLQARTREQLGRGFGERFADGVVSGAEQADLGWQGPFPSRYGHHLVRAVVARPASDPAFESVKNRIRQDLLDTRHRKAASAARRDLISKYTVLVEAPQ